jgi:hypothetical protein
MYNQDAHLCVMCDDEPAVYRGMCATCLYDSEPEVPSDDLRMKSAGRRDNTEED